MGDYNNTEYQKYVDYIYKRKGKKSDSEVETVDLHIHSEYSFDSTMKLEDIVDVMSKKKVKIIGITDHVEFSNYPVPNVIEALKRRNAKIDSLAEEANIKILKGVEVSEPHLYPKEMEALKKVKDLDMIIGAVHHIKNKKLKELPNNQTSVDLYFKELLTMVNNSDIDIIAHLDYIKRVILYYDIDMDILREILQKLITNRIALEINTSGIRRCNGEVFPNDSIIREYMSLGGDEITIGSDAHKINELYFGVEETTERLKNIVGQLTPIVYEKRRVRKINS